MMIIQQGSTERKRPRQGSSRIRSTAGRRWNVETLEQRCFMSSDGLIPGNSAFLELSFVPDGTQVAGHTSGLFAKFDALAARSDWQQRVLQAFQVWSAETNADIGLVPDNGDPLGTFGPRHQDDRFGEVRVSAAPLADNVLAISIPMDGAVAGTWGGDVIINSDANFASVDELYSVMVHEAGHVFGLDHSDDPLSPMHTHGATPVTVPTALDLSLLRDRFGTRAPDNNEIVEDNDSIANATRVKEVGLGAGEAGTAPSIAFGDIASGDQDYFLIEAPSSYEGPLSITLRTHGFSALRGTVTVYDQQENILAQGATGNVSLGQDVRLTIDKEKGENTYYVRVAGQDNSATSTGGYAVIATFDGRLQASPQLIETATSRRYRFVPFQRMRDFFEHQVDPLLSDDLHADDTFAAALDLKSLPGFVKSSKYDVHGSITDETDVDLYRFAAAAQGGAMQIEALSRDLQAGLIPELTVYDSNFNRVAATRLINGGGELALQVNQVVGGATYYLQVAAARPGVAFDRGTYDVSIGFTPEAVELPVLASGDLTASLRHASHKLYVAQPELFHFILDVESVKTSPSDAVYLSIDGTDQHVLVAPGESRSGSGILLQPGEYEISLNWSSSTGQVAADAALRYAIRGGTVSSPFGVIPIDPLTDPQFQCGEIDPRFCYPDGTVSGSGIHVVGSGTTTTGGIILIDPTDVSQDWWLLQQQDPPVGNHAPQAHAESYSATSGQTLDVTGAQGVLANDTDADDDALTAQLISAALHGTVQLNADGGFVYVSQDGYVGPDQFVYAAHDGTDVSSPVVVSIQVDAVASIVGDADRNGTFDSADLVQVFIAGQFEDDQVGNSTWETGDWNGDGEFDTADLVLAFQLGLYNNG